MFSPASSLIYCRAQGCSDSFSRGGGINKQIIFTNIFFNRQNIRNLLACLLGNSTSLVKDNDIYLAGIFTDPADL